MGLHYFTAPRRELQGVNPQVRNARAPASPRRPSQLLCSDFLWTCSPPLHSPNLGSLVCAAWCAAPPDALLAALCYHKALPHVDGVSAERLCAPDGSRAKSRPVAAQSPPTVSTMELLYIRTDRWTYCTYILCTHVRMYVVYELTYVRKDVYT